MISGSACLINIPHCLFYGYLHQYVLFIEIMGYFTRKLVLDNIGELLSIHCPVLPQNVLCSLNVCRMRTEN